jgi:hypothetical protein
MLDGALRPHRPTRMTDPSDPFDPSPRRLSQLVRRLHRRSPELPVLDAVYPQARSSTRVPLGVREIPVAAIRGTAVAGPRLRGADFRPVRAARTDGWQGRWRRLERGLDALSPLPPIEVLAVGDEYWVLDGHNRVALARRRHLGYLDANVVGLSWPGGPVLELTGADLRTGLEAGAVQRAAASGGSRASLLTPLAAELIGGRGKASHTAARCH